MSSGQRNCVTEKSSADVANLQGQDHQPIERRSTMHTNSRRSVTRISSQYEPNFKSIYRCVDYTRPLPNKEDTVIYLKKKEIGLAHVHRVARKLPQFLYEDIISGQTLEMETIPSCRRIHRFVEEVFVVDRAFSTGETVIKFENEFVGNPAKEHMRIPRFDTAIGQVVNVEVRGDVLMMPRKNIIVKNVPLGKIEYTEMVNYSSSQNYIIYKEWIGNATDCINDVTLIYRGRYRFVIREGGRSGVFLSRQDRSDEMKALVPGECVSIAISDALGRLATWEQKPPKCLTCSRRRRATEGIKCVIEKIETHSLIVDWITSPSSTITPPKIIPKSELGNVIRIDPSANPRPSTGDRVKIVPDSLSTLTTVEDYFICLTEQFRCIFNKFTAKEDPSVAHCEMCSKSSQVELKQKSFFTKGSKVARLSHNTESSRDSKSVSPRSTHVSDRGSLERDTVSCGGVHRSSTGSTEDETPSTYGRSKVAVSRSLIRQKRIRKYPVRRRRCTPFPIDSTELPKEILNTQFIGEVLLAHTLVDVQWMNGTIERQIPGYLLIPCDPDLDQQDHLPGVIVARKEAKSTDAVFGVILSTDCAERSCIVSWFERREYSVEKIAEEECTLFDIMAHPVYKRSFIGSYGVSVNHPSDNMHEMAFQIVADLKNGKQLVRFLNGNVEELWPFDILPICFSIQFMDESMNSESDEDGSSILETDLLSDSSLFSVTLEDAQKVLSRLGFLHWQTSSERCMADTQKVISAVECFVRSFPQLENFSKECCQEDDDARKAGILFAGVVLEATGTECDESSKSLLQFASVITAVYRSRLLPENFDIQLLFVLIDGYRRDSAVLKSFVFNKEGVELISYLYESVNNARNHPEWLLIFHCISDLLRGHDKNSVRIALRSEFYKLDDPMLFCPRYLSLDYVLSVTEAIQVIRDVIDGDHGSTHFQECDRCTTSLICSLNEPPSMTLTLRASAQQMMKELDCSTLSSTLMAQILDCESWPIHNINLIFNKDVKFLDVPSECKSNTALNSAINKTFAAALVLLKRCRILSQAAIHKNCIWKDLDFFFSDTYEPSVEVEYATLHEIVMFVRSVDFLNSSLLQRLMDFTHAYSFEAIHCKVVRAFHEKFKEIQDICDLPCNPSTPKESEPFTLCEQYGCVKGTFEVLDEFLDFYPHELSDVPMEKKFYTTVFKEHRMLAENLPDNIHVHAFANRLNILHVLIIGPAGTPFDTTPFFFKFRLPYDYPQKPPDVTYVAYSQEQLNPNLYQNGTVCTSLLGTWSGQGVETWNPMKSNLLQVLLSIQALILVPEPYFNEAGYENRKHRTEMVDRSRRYNETAAVNSLEYLHKIYMEPPTDFKNMIREFVRKSWPRLHHRITGWISGKAPPSFPVMNSKGFKVALQKAVCSLATALNYHEEEQKNEEPIETGGHTNEQVYYEWSVKL